MFTVSLENQAVILEGLLELYYPEGARAIDFTYGTGALWWNVFENPRLKEMYKVTKCDAEPSLPEEVINQLDLTKDDYAHLGKHEVGVFDPPYLDRPSFDYPNKSKVLNSNISNTQVLAMQYQGKRSWAAKKLNRFVANLEPHIFSQRVESLLRVAPSVLTERGLLFVKIMNPRKKGILTDHGHNIKNILGSQFDLIDELVYIRMGATTWKTKNHLQNLHGYWLIFQKKSSERLA